MSKYPQPILSVIAYLKKLPGVGSKSAERFAFQLLQWPKNQLEEFASSLRDLNEKIEFCHECGCLKDGELCIYCSSQREQHSLCIISSAKDVYPIEETKVFKGTYHVIGGLLSPLDGKTPKDLRIDSLKDRIIKRKIKDVIIALDSTLEGDATSLYLKELLHSWGVSVFRPAMGLPMGSSLDYIDGGTLARALVGKQNF